MTSIAKFKAKFHSKCFKCGGVIKPGDMVEWARRRSPHGASLVWHEQCPKARRTAFDAMMDDLKSIGATWTDEERSQAAGGRDIGSMSVDEIVRMPGVRVDFVPDCLRKK